MKTKHTSKRLIAALLIATLIILSLPFSLAGVSAQELEDQEKIDIIKNAWGNLEDDFLSVAPSNATASEALTSTVNAPLPIGVNSDSKWVGDYG